MWEGFIVATICTGWLCKSIHGEEFRYPLNRRFDTEEQCRWEGEMILTIAAGRIALIDPGLKPHVECRRGGV